jgi:hypothetical protein
VEYPQCWAGGELGIEELLLQQVFDVIDHFFAAVGSDFNNARVHADGVFRTGLHTEAAENAHPHVDVEALGIFFDMGIGMLSSHDIDAPGWAGRFAHHAGDAARGAIRAPSEPVTAAITRGERAALFGILKRDCTFLNAVETELTRQVLSHVAEEVPAGQPQAFENFEQVQTLFKSQFTRVHRFVFRCSGTAQDTEIPGALLPKRTIETLSGNGALESDAPYRAKITSAVASTFRIDSGKIICQPSRISWS